MYQQQQPGYPMQQPMGQPQMNPYQQQNPMMMQQQPMMQPGMQPMMQPGMQPGMQPMMQPGMQGGMVMTTTTTRTVGGAPGQPGLPPPSEVQPGQNQGSDPQAKVNGQFEAVTVSCPKCNRRADTDIKRDTTGKQWCYCVVFSVCLLIPCALIPFCMKDCWKVKHFCSNCENYIGTAKDE